MLSPPLAGDGLQRVPMLTSSFTSYRDVVVDGIYGRRVWAPDAPVAIGSLVTIEGSSWRVVAHADDPIGPPQPIYGDCGEVYVDEHEVLLLLG